MIAARYHESTKHHFERFAPSLGYLDWATQPNPFRRYEGALVRPLPRHAIATAPYSALYADGGSPAPVTTDSIGEFLRCAVGVSAWKQHGQSRWALRVNPSSGNLHPTEVWVVQAGLVAHYAPREHALEERCVLDMVGQAFGDGHEQGFLVALTSIVWREAWKYGERAFRYCQHDTGHAIGALRLSAAMFGWRMRILPHWSDTQVEALLGLDRDEDYGDAEREEPECVALVSAAPGAADGRRMLASTFDPDRLIARARVAKWGGRANKLSANHVEWPLIREVVEATRYPGMGGLDEGIGDQEPVTDRGLQGAEERSARDVVLQRRSALAFNPRGVLRRDVFLAVLARLQPSFPPWDVLDWPPQVHLVVYVHRVQDLTSGIYAYVRAPGVVDEWKVAMRPAFLWEPQGDNLFLLVPAAVDGIARRLSCDQDIAADGFFSLSMIARFEAPLRAQGQWFYRRLFWECGLIGQVLYLEAEAAGARATGIGCYYDDPTHELLGLSGHAWQSLYHFSMGLPVDDSRLTTEPGYAWEMRG